MSIYTAPATSATIVDGAIIDADVNASAAIAGTKISPNFGAQAVVTTGTITGASLIPSSATVPANGLYLPAANSVALSTGTSERARIDSSGRLLVGTSSSRSVGNSERLFQIESVNADASLSLTRNSNDASTASLIFGKTRGSALNDNTIVQNGDILGRILFAGADGVDVNSSAARIDCAVDGTPGTNDMPGRLVFSTTADGASSPTERLRIDSTGVLQIADAGNITVGTTTGTKIGTATTQKLGFYNATPVVQPAAVADATDAASVITQLNALLSRLRTLGIIAT